jgi:hypothetical protein
MQTKLFEMAKTDWPLNLLETITKTEKNVSLFSVFVMVSSKFNGQSVFAISNSFVCIVFKGATFRWSNNPYHCSTWAEPGDGVTPDQARG